jgi:antitoxin ParD1/3/4
MRTSKPISVTLGPLQARATRRLESGQYDNASEVLPEEVRASMADKRPSVLAEQVFARLRARHERKLNAAKRGA